jgi:hypothetical protein
MIMWKSVGLEDKEKIDAYYKPYKSEVSDYSFTQLLIWSDAYQIEYAIIEGCLIVKLKDPSETLPYIHMPVGSGDIGRAVQIVKEAFESRGDYLTIRSITKNQFFELKKATKLHLKFKLLRNQYEYIYPTNDLSKLNTKKLKRKLDMYRRFSRQHDIKVSPMSMDDSEKISALLLAWSEGAPSSEILEAERMGIERVLNNWNHLDAQGCVIEVAGHPVAFSIGEPLTDNTFLILAEKATREFKGAYVAVIKEFAGMYTGTYKFTNREEDLGIPGLRKAKLLFRPCRFVEKGVAYFKNGNGERGGKMNEEDD